MTHKTFVILFRNDLKWTYATSPFAAPVGAAVSTGQAQVYNTPRLTAHTEVMMDTQNQLMDLVY